MIKFVTRIFAVFLILLFLTPLPGGSLTLALGVSMLICSSLPFALWVQRMRTNYSKINKSFKWLEEKLGEKWARVLLITRPEADPRVHFNSNFNSSSDSNPNSKTEKS